MNVATPEAIDCQINRRILVIDDNLSIHDVFRQILAGSRGSGDLVEDHPVLFVEAPPSALTHTFCVDCADQGQVGFALLEQAIRAEQPYALAFVDMRMLPGWDGVETIERLWQVDPRLEIVLCTAFSDHAWEQVLDRLGDQNEHLLILRKPFDTIEVRQLANSLTAKWHLARQADLQVEDLKALVEQRTAELHDINVQLQRDIVRRREVEQQLARAAEELTRTNQELAHTNEELSKARDQALVSAKTKAEFLAVMSHELRSPLSVIIGYAALILEQTFGELSDSQVSVMQKIDRHARNLHELIDGVLDFSRLEAGQLPIDLQQVHVSELLDDIQAGNPVWREKPELACEWQTQPSLPCLSTDPGKLKIVLKNLISNAVKFTEDGGITIRATVEDGGIQFSISDTGIGIPEDALPLIFEPFRQLDSSDSRRYGGTGLGLHVVKRLVELLGGKISVTSRIDYGSTFQVWLPVEKTQSAEVWPPGTEQETLPMRNGHADPALSKQS